MELVPPSDVVLDFADLVTQEETKQIVATVCEFAGEKGATREHFDKVLGWVLETRVNLALLDGVLDGRNLVGVDDNGEVAFASAAGS